MKKYFLLFIFFVFSYCADIQVVVAQSLSLSDSAFIRENYQKYEYQVPTRDGIKLYTAVYIPKDISPTNQYPIMLSRTPYSCSPYGLDKYPRRLSPSPIMMREKYIVVYQDVRGRYMSEGVFTEMTPHKAQKIDKKKDVDESTDTYDTIDWLLKNLKNHNGRVGMWGISYPGFYTSAGMLANHPALKASSPQAPIADLYRDDSFHNGAFMLAANFGFYNFFVPHLKPNDGSNRESLFKMDNPDGYDFYLKMGSLKNSQAKYYQNRNIYWTDILEHPNFDKFWQDRNLLPHFKGIKHAVMTVGGWYDAEDLFGTMKTYQYVEKQNPNIHNIFVLGPWVHGGWARINGGEFLGDVNFGAKTSNFYQENIEAKFFKQILKEGKTATDLPEAYIFETGTNQWRTFANWPPKESTLRNLYLQNNGKLSFAPSTQSGAFSEFLSDPHKPVPFTNAITTGMIQSYMVEDQRFASKRPDVLVFETEVLTEDITLAGNLLAKLKVSTSETDADWIVKIIDVYPLDTPNNPQKPEIKYGGFQQMVRSEAIRGRFRKSLEKPSPFVPNQIAEVNVELQDILHTFKKGHKIMIQIQSSWFPLIDRNPQKYVDNIFLAEDNDFTKATHRVYHSVENQSFIEVRVMNK
jgi:putative CocE/NonD family hydrolase